MKRTIRENIHAPYSLHDMNVSAFEISGDDIVMRMQSGMVRCTSPCEQVEGHVEFHKVGWDFSYAYLLSVNGNTGSFSGSKMELREFIRSNPKPNFTILDETYGYNRTNYSGYITVDDSFCECNIEIYHEGDMVFVEE
ncbi:MAG: hypothetical protein E7335_06185 [Clostridiales bacterium]|nr:hypothetical protein [Clostridiales bacterium]